jgi:hypothetical protein
MKKILVAGFLLSIVLQSFSQRLIPAIGFTLSKFSLQDEYLTEYPKLGFSAGAAYEVPITEKFYIQPEINFLQKGSYFGYGDEKNKLTLYYIEFPVLAKFKFTTKNARYNIFGGPSVGVGVAGRFIYYSDDGNIRKYDVQFRSNPFDEDEETTYPAYVDNRIDAGIQIGAELELKKVIIGLRYNQSIKHLYTNKNRMLYYSEPLLDGKNQVIQFSVGLPIALTVTDKIKEPEENRFHPKLIPRAGITVSNISFGFSDAPESTTGFMAGLGYELELSNHFLLGAEINFIQKGAKWEYDQGENFSLKLNYLEIPILGKYKMGPEKIKFQFSLGPSISYGLGGSYEAKISGSTTKTNVAFGPAAYEFGTSYFQNVNNTLDLGVQGGIGVRLNEKIIIETRYGLGLTNLYSKEVNFDGRNAKNRSLQFSVGVPLKLL